MAKKNKKAESGAAAGDNADRGREQARRKQGSLMRQAWPFAALLAALIFVFLAATSLLVRNAEDAHRAELSGLYGEHYRAMLDSYLRSHRTELNAYPDAELLRYLQGDAGAAGLLSRFPGALQARVVSISLDPATLTNLSFAHQDVVARLAAGERVTPEISFYESGSVKAQVVTFARLLKDEAGTPAAAFLLSFPFEPLANVLKGLAPQGGAMELTQKVGTQKASILRIGNVDAAAATEVPTGNPGWEVRFAPPAASVEDGSLAPVLLGLAIFLPLLGAGVFAWGVSSLQKKVRQDIEAIDTFTDNFLHYGARQRPALHFEFSGRLLDHLDRYSAELRAGRALARSGAGDELGDIGVADDPSSLFGEGPAPKAARSSQSVSKKQPAGEKAMEGLKSEIFRAYDVRGIVGQGLSKEVARALGLAIGSEALARGDNTVVVGRDGRLSGPELSNALIDGLRATGCDVVDVGMVPTPVLYFAAKTRANGSGVMVTGSHNPANYNGFKIMLAGDTLAGEEIQALRKRIETGDYASGSGGLSQINVAQEYVDRVAADIALARPLRVVVDGGNGVAGPIGVRALEAAGCEIVPLFCEIDGNFPNHHPDPSKPQNLEDLISVVASNNADLGIAFDGDGDRVGVVTAAGKIIYPDRLMMLYAKHVLTTNPGADIIFDVKCTRDLPNLISSLGGRPVMCKTGHSFIKGKLKETGAALAGEMSGHVFFNDRWFGFDDAIYSAARLLEIMSLESGDSDQVFAEFPENPSTPEINIPVPDESKFDLMEALRTNADFPNANVITLDGLRVEFDEGWGLVRASNTTPCLVARFEGKTPAALADVQTKFKALLNNVDANLQIPF